MSTEETAAAPPNTEQPETAAPAAAEGNNDDHQTAAAADTGDKPAGGDKKTNKGRKEYKQQKDETPIEELYDLSQPIPHVPRPSKDDQEKEVGAINSQIDALKAERQALQTKIEGNLTGKGGNPAAEAAKDELKKLRAQKGGLIDEKKALRAQLDAARNANDKLQNERKAAQSSVGKFRNLQEIEAEIARLHKRQETTSMSLAEEKRLIKDIDALESSKKTVASIKSKDDELNATRDQKKALQTQLNAKDKEIDAVQSIIDDKSAALKAIYDQEADKRGDMQKLFQARDELRSQINDLITQRNAIRDAYREDNNQWYNYQRAVRKQKQIKYEEEKAAREAEKQAWIKAKEEEEAKKIPYEEEMALCDYLAEYLTRTYLTDATEAKKKAEEDLKAKKKAAEGVVEVKAEDNPFANFKPVGKSKDDAEEVFLQMGKGTGGGKKKRQRNKAAKSKAKAATSFTLSVDSFEQFGLLGLTPPTSIDAVAKSVDELQARKEWYSQQPRGAVKTAQDIRKENEKNAARIQNKKEVSGGDGGNAGGGKSKKNGGAASGEEEELTLGAGSVATGPVGQWAGRAAV